MSKLELRDPEGVVGAWMPGMWWQGALERDSPQMWAVKQVAEQTKDSPLVFMECLVISTRIPRNMWTGKDNKVGFPVAKSDGGLHYFY